MVNLLESATKIVFMFLAISACIAFFIGKLEQDNFMNLCLMAFTFYFAYKGSDTVVEKTEPFAGK